MKTNELVDICMGVLCLSAAFFLIAFSLKSIMGV